jgi:hypothetical protein
MTCIRFDFESDFSIDKQEAFLAWINKDWTAVEEAGRLKADTGNPDLFRRCYLKLRTGQVDIDRIARALAAALRATSGVSDAFVVEEGWPISD